jgi:acyl-CoA dehydrogenase
MYIMGTLLRHGSEAQKRRCLPGIASGALLILAFTGEHVLGMPRSY